MTVFYKATRPDGTDFYTGLVDYAAAPLRAPTAHRYMRNALLLSPPSRRSRSIDNPEDTNTGGME